MTPQVRQGFCSPPLQRRGCSFSRIESRPPKHSADYVNPERPLVAQALLPLQVLLLLSPMHSQEWLRDSTLSAAIKNGRYTRRKSGRGH
jgi:hypothetical protein